MNKTDNHNYLSHFLRILILAFLVFVVENKGFSQEFGGNPPSMKWKQINTDTVRVIYPQNLESQAQRVANTIHYLNRNNRSSIGDNQKKINVVLQNQTIISNGYVGLAPFRSEFYLNAPQNGFSLGSNWLDMLTIHEYRHVMQKINTRRGITNVAYYLSGELGWSYLSSLIVPNWFSEGDAVVSETALTAQGRGRLPSFYNGYKSLVFNQKTYNYQKASNGSLKDFVPNHYNLGFLLSNYGREQYGNNFWKEVVADAGKFKGLFYPFSKSIKRQTGVGTKGLYNKSMDYYGTQWSEQSRLVDNSENINRPNKKKTFTSYQYPHRLENGNLLVYKASFKNIGGFFEIDDAEHEHLIRNQGRVIDNYFSYNNNQIVWAELGQDVRWSWKSYSNIVLYDLGKKQRRKLTTTSRYFSPDLSSDNSKIVVFQTTPELKYQLLVLSSTDGTVIYKLDNPENYYYSYPKWTKDDRNILALARDGLGRTALVKISIDSGDHEVLIPFTNHQLGIPSEGDDYIFLSGSFNGIDNIIAVEKSTNNLFRVTNGSLGSYHAFADETNNELLFSRFSVMGNDIKNIEINKDQWEELVVVEPVNMPDYDFVASREEGGDITERIPDRSFETKKYPKSSKLVNVHSWSLYFQDPDYEWAIKSNNILNTLTMDLGVRYNRNDEAFTYFFNAEYAQFYPSLFFTASAGRRSVLALLQDEQGIVRDTAKVSWWESIVRPGVTIPLNLSSSLYTRQLNLTGYYSLTNVNYTNQTKEIIQIQDQSYDSYTAGFAFINRRKKAKQNIFSKYSQYVSVSYDRLIDNQKVEQIFVDSEWTFPGLFANHNLVFQAAFQQEDPKSFPRFGDSFRYARGYNRPIYDVIYKIGTNYHLPVIYPDWGFWGIAYLYRVRANAFFDYSRSHYTQTDSNYETIQLYNSLGGEIMLDTRILNNFEFTFGFRYSYLLNDDYSNKNLKQTFEFFIPVIRF